MTNEQIIEGDEAILKFMKFRFLAHVPSYSKDWNSLMGVVDKIESLDYTVDIAGKSCGVHDNNSDIDEDFNFTGMESIFFDGENKIMSTWKAIVAFIEYHNQNK